VPRDRVQEVAKAQKRRGRNSVAYSLWLRLEALQDSTPPTPEEFLDYKDLLPIRAVTILEVLTRECVADLINAGHPYTERAQELGKRGGYSLILLPR